MSSAPKWLQRAAIAAFVLGVLSAQLLPAYRFYLLLSAIAALAIAYLLELHGSRYRPRQVSHAAMKAGELVVTSGHVAVLDNWTGDRAVVLSCASGTYAIEISLESSSEPIASSIRLTCDDRHRVTHEEYSGEVAIDSGFLIIADESFVRSWDSQGIEDKVLQMMEAQPETSYISLLGGAGQTCGVAVFMDDGVHDLTSAASGVGWRIEVQARG